MSDNHQPSYSNQVTMEAVDVAAAYILVQMKYSSSSSLSSLSFQNIDSETNINATYSTPVFDNNETHTAPDSEMDAVTIVVPRIKRKARILDVDFEDDEETSDGFNGKRFKKSPQEDVSQSSGDAAPSFSNKYLKSQSFKYWNEKQRFDSIKRLRRHLMRTQTEQK